MRWKGMNFRRKCQFPVLLASGSLPVPMLICALAAPDRVDAALAVMALYIALAWMCLLIRGRLRLAAGVLFSAALMGAGAVLLPVREVHAALLIPALYAGMLLGGLQMAGWDRGRELHPAVCILCVVAHILAQILVNVGADLGEASPYAPVDGILIAGFVCYGALMLLYLNRVSLRSAVNGMQAVPVTIRRKNFLLTAALFAVTMTAAGLPAVARAVGCAWEALKAVAAAVIRWLISLFPETATTGADVGSGPGGMPAMDAAELGLFAVIMEKIAMVLAAVAASVLAAIALIVLWKKCKALLNRLWARLNDYLTASTEDYQDEIVDTREDATAERAVRRLHRRGFRRRVDERALKPAERVRYRYQRTWLRHPEWTPERTARENLPEGAAEIYERARYSDHPVTDADAEEFARRTDLR